MQDPDLKSVLGATNRDISNQCSKRQMVKLIKIEIGGEARDEEEEETRDDICEYEAMNANVDEGILLS
jgi:phosphoribosylformylglycinamidine (FGAM) synthase PurS component